MPSAFEDPTNGIPEPERQSTNPDVNSYEQNNVESEEDARFARNIRKYNTIYSRYRTPKKSFQKIENPLDEREEQNDFFSRIQRGAARMFAFRTASLEEVESKMDRSTEDLNYIQNNKISPRAEREIRELLSPRGIDPKDIIIRLKKEGVTPETTALLEGYGLDDHDIHSLQIDAMPDNASTLYKRDDQFLREEYFKALSRKLRTEKPPQFSEKQRAFLVRDMLENNANSLQTRLELQSLGFANWKDLFRRTNISEDKKNEILSRYNLTDGSKFFIEDPRNKLEKVPTFWKDIGQGLLSTLAVSFFSGGLGLPAALGATIGSAAGGAMAHYFMKKNQLHGSEKVAPLDAQILESVLASQKNLYESLVLQYPEIDESGMPGREVSDEEKVKITALQNIVQSKYEEAKKATAALQKIEKEFFWPNLILRGLGGLAGGYGAASGAAQYTVNNLREGNTFTMYKMRRLPDETEGGSLIKYVINKYNQGKLAVVDGAGNIGKEYTDIIQFRQSLINANFTEKSIAAFLSAYAAIGAGRFMRRPYIRSTDKQQDLGYAARRLYEDEKNALASTPNLPETAPAVETPSPSVGGEPNDNPTTNPEPNPPPNPDNPPVGANTDRVEPLTPDNQNPDVLTPQQVAAEFALLGIEQQVSPEAKGRLVIIKENYRRFLEVNRGMEVALLTTLIRDSADDSVTQGMSEIVSTAQEEDGDDEEGDEGSSKAVFAILCAPTNLLYRNNQDRIQLKLERLGISEERLKNLRLSMVHLKEDDANYLTYAQVTQYANQLEKRFKR